MKYRLLAEEKGRGEPIRMILHYGDEPFEDVRIAREDVPEMKAKTPLGEFPVLECDGRQLIQTKAICRYLAKSFKLTGKTKHDSATCDLIVDVLFDLYDSSEQVIRLDETDPRKKEMHWRTLYSTSARESLSRLTAFLHRSGTGYFVTDEITWTDIVVFALLSYMQEHFSNMFKGHKELELYLAFVRNNAKINSYYANK